MSSTFTGLVASGLAGAAVAISLVGLIFRLRRPTRRPLSSPISAMHLGPVEQLSFTESLDPERFSNAANVASLEILRAHWQGVLGNGATVIMNGVRLFSSKTEMIVSASVKGRALVASGLASVSRHGESGRLLPILTDPKTGKIIELMKGAPAARRLAQLTALSSMAVGAAHLIASADIAKKLKLIDGKLDELLAYRRIDQTSVLERIYTSAKELACGPIDESKRLEMWRLRGELRQLRSTWRLELQFHLSHIEEPVSAGWLGRQLNAVAGIVRGEEGGSDRRVHSKITEGQLHLSLIEYALRLDHILAVGSDTLSGFERTLADELVEMRGVADLLEAKAGYISRKKESLSVEPMLTGMRAMIDHYDAILPRRIAAAERPQPELQPADFLPSA